MQNRKSLREHGKIKLSRYFQTFANGDKVTVIMEHAAEPKFPKQIQGRTGIVSGIRGDSYIIKMNDLNKEKIYIIHPVHLKKLI